MISSEMVLFVKCIFVNYFRQTRLILNKFVRIYHDYKKRFRFKNDTFNVYFTFKKFIAF